MKSIEIQKKKKEILLQILSNLTEFWTEAKWLYNFVESLKFEDNNIIEELLEIIENSVDKIKNQENQKIMKKWVNIIKNIQKLEEKEIEEELKNIELSLEELNKF